MRDTKKFQEVSKTSGCRESLFVVFAIEKDSYYFSCRSGFGMVKTKESSTESNLKDGSATTSVTFSVSYINGIRLGA